MPRKLSLLLCLLVLASPSVFADIAFSGSGSSGTISPGQPFSYDFDLGFDWGVPGVGAGLGTWAGPTVDGFTITFNLPSGVSIDPLAGTNCNGGSGGGTVFCASPYSQPWDVTVLTSNSITFKAQQGGDLLTNGDQFFVNIFFTGGDPNGASFSGAWLAPSPEPGSMLLFGSGALALVGVLRWKKLK